MIPPEIMELSHTVREVLAERGPLTTAGIGVYLPGRQPDDIAAAVHVLKHADRIRRCGRREGRAVWSLSDRPAEAPPVRLSQASLRSLCRDRGDIDVMAEAVPADRYAYTSKRQRMLAEQYGVGLVYVHDRTGDRLPQYVERQARAAGWRAVRLGSVLRDSGARQATVWGLIRMPVYAGGLE